MTSHPNPFATYLRALRGRHQPVPKRLPLSDIGISFLGGFIGMLLVAVVHYVALLDTHISISTGAAPHQLVLLYGALGASTALLFGSPQLPKSQPFNCLVGHSISAVYGLAMHYAFRSTSLQWLGVAIAGGLSIGSMLALRAYHPPAGSTAVLAAMGTGPALQLGWFWIILPVLSGALMLCAVAVVWNNLFPRRAPYPLYWIPFP